MDVTSLTINQRGHLELGDPDDSPRTETVATMPVPLLDVSRENALIRDEWFHLISTIFESGRFVLGPECDRFEAAFAEFCEIPHALGCASGSDALLLALMALGVGPGDEVILPSFTFFATASCVSRLGATPVFAEIDPESFCLTPDSLREAITTRTKAAIPVHLFGQPVQLDRIAAVAREHGLRIVEDCAQATGARYRGARVGTQGDVGCFSFYPTKNLAAQGDGGMLTTHDAELAARLRRLRVHGMEPRYVHRDIGINSRLDAIQAAALSCKLPYVDRWNDQRRDAAARYDHMFREARLDDRLGLPIAADELEHVWNQYTIRVPRGQRDALKLFLAATCIGTEVYYPIPLHLQPCFEYLGVGRGSLPITEAAAQEVLSLPMFPTITDAEQRSVVHRIHQFLER